MSGFLANLAALASGTPQPGAARLALPARFAASNAVLPVVEEVATTTQAADIQPDVSSAGTRVTEGDTPLPGHRTRAPSVEQVTRPAADPLSAQQQTSRPSSSERQAVAEISARRPALSSHDLSARTDASAEQPVSMPPLHPREDYSAQPAAPLQRAIPARASATHPAPLSEAAVAGRTTADRGVRPIVHVTIDRIDVRAPREAPRATPAPRRAKPESSVSLADYLKVRS
ncbi:MAG: hypothetical protein ACREVL_09515 [Solimonas sp.]